MITAVYARVSTADQTTENQLREIEAKGIVPNMTFTETVSGSVAAMERPAFRDTLAALKAVSGPRRLVVTKLDRLGRNTSDILGTLDILGKMGCGVVVLQLGDLDLTSTAGKLMVTMLAAVATMERDLLIERTHAGLARARSEGKKGGRPEALSEDRKELARGMLASGLSVKAVAGELGVARATVAKLKAVS
ncbi:recombinase family protein [Amaricoccus solimangrovi]|uniref:Recombinase family protein n=1 Tax=Amaricoccus solimangrovi TaxID=2589815 RepID=A0A501WJG4_9RHOB|nr:recombinase family protein [Amaricoccus solimangrovi]TPE48922.1 recombinase family protein [Amaricoccus solimangrovi]